MAKIELATPVLTTQSLSSASYRVPKGQKGTVEFHAKIDDITFEDLATRFALHVDISDDGISWRYAGGIVFQGYKRTADEKPDCLPGIGFNVRDFTNKYVRVRIDGLSKTTLVGAEVEVF